MRIYFEPHNQNQNVDKATTSQETPSYCKTQKMGAYALDISGTVMDNTAYGVHGRTTEDVMQDAAALDIGVQRDYMTVMSNSMSAKDFNKMMEDGFDPAQMDVEQVVTIVDHIKAIMAESGEIIAGYNDDISAEKLTEITGNAGYAAKIQDALKNADAPVSEENVGKVKEAVDKVKDFTKLSDGSVKFMVENGLDPTIENIYRASYSAGGDGNRQGRGYYAQELPGYYAKKADTVNQEELAAQIEKVVSEMELSEEFTTAKEDARWLVEKGIPVTQEAVERLHDIRQIQFPLSPDDIIRAAAMAIGEGKQAENALLSGNASNIYEQAVWYRENTQNITEDAVYQVIGEEKAVNLKNLIRAQAELQDITPGAHNDRIAESEKYITATRQLVQIQLKMTITANIRLLKSDFSIDTAPLSRLVEALENQENILKSRFFGEEEALGLTQKSTLYRNTTDVLRELPYMPAAVIGRMSVEEGTVSLSYLHTTGTALRTQYEAAGTAYETLMTTPRSDLGDSIKKAFRNVDDILTDLGKEITEENRKAVRILGYNNMEISQESLETVKSAQRQVEDILKEMTPAKTLSLIREGVNPLTMSLENLETELKNIAQKPEEETEKYAKFLYRLERNKEITQPERDAYIGIYRLFHQIEKSDGAAVGSLISQGADLTLGNLLSAVRSRKAKNMDVNIDDSFGMLQEKIEKGTSISAQIENGILKSRMTRSIYRDMTPELLKQAGITEESTLEELDDAIRNQNQAENRNPDYNENAYVNDKMGDFLRASQAEAHLLQMMKDYQIPCSVNNVLAAERLMQEKGDLFRQLKSYAEKTDEENAFEKAVFDVVEHFTGKEEAKQAYDTFLANAADILKEAADTVVDTTIDIKTLSLCHKQLSLAGALSNNENYELPVVLNGTLTSINLTIVHNSEEKGCVSAAFETELSGKTGAKFYVRDNQIEAFLVAEKETGEALLREAGKLFKGAMEASGKEVTDIHYAVGNSIDLITFSEQSADNHNEQTATKELYQTAKVFLSGIQKVFK